MMQYLCMHDYHTGTDYGEVTGLQATLVQGLVAGVWAWFPW